ncbi:MAG TPA: cobalamin biosynthesis protein, partial [Streptosporangiaceae bacterium]
MIGLIAVTAAGREGAARLMSAWPGEARLYDGPAKQALPRVWAECHEIVCFLAVGATSRLIAPLLESKWVDPAVVCVDQAARFAVPLVGGHAAGANALAARVAEVLGAEAVITTATDAVGVPGLDALGWPAEGALGTVSRALLDGEKVVLEADVTWPIPPLPATPGGGPGSYRILITDRVVAPDEFTVVLRPPSLVVGVGASSGVTAEEVLGLIDGTLSLAGLATASVTALATVDAKANEPGIVEAAQARGWPLLTHPAARLASIEVPSPSDAALAAVGTPSVAEAAALAGADTLVMPKRKSPMAT